MSSAWGIAKEKGVLLQIEVRVNLLWVVKEVHLPDVLDEDYQCRPNMILVQSRFVTFATESILEENWEKSPGESYQRRAVHMPPDTSREELWWLMNCPSFFAIGIGAVSEIVNPWGTRSDLAHNHQVHKRFDPIYNDARQRIQNLGTFGYLLVAHWGVGVGELVPLNLGFYG